jgi:HAD superfamily hydrolase (TIGR01459 family)
VSGGSMTVDTLQTAVIAGLSEIADRYRAVVVDLWGVIHDGESVYPGADDALYRLRERGTAICLLSNSPRRAAEAESMLIRMGISHDAYSHMVTSGEITFETLRDPPDAWHAALGMRYLPIGPSARNGLLAGLDRVATEGVDEADFVLNTGTDGCADITAYKPLLDDCAARNLPMVCANPDLTVMVGQRTVACAGSLAQYYESVGGNVRYHGKPHALAYRRCLDKLGLDTSAVLAIGDALRTDIAGANAVGLDSVFVTGGIHCAELGADWGLAPLPGRLADLLERTVHRPTFAVPRFSW